MCLNWSGVILGYWNKSWRLVYGLCVQWDGELILFILIGSFHVLLFLLFIYCLLFIYYCPDRWSDFFSNCVPSCDMSRERKFQVKLHFDNGKIRVFFVFDISQGFRSRS